MSTCGCNSCGDCSPRLNGTEVMILSGTDGQKSTTATSSESKTGLYMVLGTALALALVVGFTKNNKKSA